MNAYLLPGLLGLLTGLLLHWAGFSRSIHTRLALGLRRSYAVRTALTAVGWAMILTALLMWLAVIDVDEVTVLPLSLGALLGGTILGISAGLCGFTPTTAFAGVSTRDGLSALCVLAGCFAGALLFPSLDDLFTSLRTASPYAATTLFKVTLDEPFLLSGGFLAQACAGLLPVVIGLCIPSPRPVIIDVPAEPESTQEESAEPAPDSPDPESAPEETFVALLEGEEPLVVDTALEEERAASPEEEEVSGEGDSLEEDDSLEEG